MATKASAFCSEGVGTRASCPRQRLGPSPNHRGSAQSSAFHPASGYRMRTRGSALRPARRPPQSDRHHRCQEEIHAEHHPEAPIRRSGVSNRLDAVAPLDHRPERHERERRGNGDRHADQHDRRGHRKSVPEVSVVRMRDLPTTERGSENASSISPRTTKLWIVQISLRLSALPDAVLRVLEIRRCDTCDRSLARATQASALRVEAVQDPRSVVSHSR